MRMRNCFVTIELSGNTVTPPYSEDFIFQIPDCFRERKEIENYSMNALRENERNLRVARMLEITKAENASAFDWRLFLLHAYAEELALNGICRLRDWEGELTKEMLLYQVTLKLW